MQHKAANMNAGEFIEALLERDMLDADGAATLRHQIETAGREVEAHEVAALLISREELTHKQASRILGEDAMPAPLPPEEPPEVLPADDDIPVGVDPELMEDDEEDIPTVAAETIDAETIDAEPAGLTPLDDAGGLQPLDGGLQPLDGGLQPLDAGGGLDAFGMDGGLQPAEPAPPAPKHKKKAVRGNPWESPFLWGGGVLLLVLIGSGVLLYFVLSRGNATAMYEVAEKAYADGSYSQAIEHYDNFLESFPSDKNSGAARVRRGLAMLRIEVNSKNDMDGALKVAEEVLPEMNKEEKMEEARAELSGLLPTIAEGFAARARKTPETEGSRINVELALRAMKLVNNPDYLPSSQRKAQLGRIEKIEEEIRIEQREINRDFALAEALKNITAQLKEGDTIAAYETREKLVKEYNDLETNEQLRAAVLKISDAVAGKATTDNLNQEPLPGERTAPVAAQLLPSASRGDGDPALNGQLLAFLVNGSVYGVDGGKGKLLWKQFVGYDTVYHPQPMEDRPGSDILLVDARYDELQRVKAATGEVVWRQQIGEEFARPLVTADAVIVTTRSGRVCQIEAATGKLNVATQLPQATTSAPGIDAANSRLFQPGGHSNLYMMSALRMSVSGVHYLGHKSGAIETSPVVWKGHVFVAVNEGPDFAMLHVLTVSGSEIKKAQPPIRLDGRVSSSMKVLGRRVMVVTELGAYYLFDVDLSSKARPVKTTISTAAVLKKPTRIYTTGEGSNLWAAEERLAYYQVQPALSELSTPVVKFGQDTFISPLQMAPSGAVFHARRPQNSPAYVVAASRKEDDKPLWEMEIGTPLIDGLAIDKTRGEYVGMSVFGRLFRIPAGEVSKGDMNIVAPWAPNATSTGPQYAHRTEIGDGRLAFTAAHRGDLLLVYDPENNARPVRQRKYKIPEEPLTGPPAAFKKAVLAPSAAGQIFWLDPGSETVKSAFQPQLKPGEKVVWRRPLVLDGGEEFVVGDNRGFVYRVGVKKSVDEYLAELQKSKAPGALLSGFAQVDKNLFVAGAGNGGDQLLMFELPKLELKSQTPLGGRWTWGPYKIGGNILAASDRGGLLCVDGAGKKLWQAPLAYGPLTGHPMLLTAGSNTDYVICTEGGVVWRVSSKDGAEVGSTNLGEPLQGGPTPNRNGYLIPGADGAFHLIEPPASYTEAAQP